MLCGTLSIRLARREERDVLRDRVAPDAQSVGREVGIGVADGQGVHDRKFRRNLELVASYVRITDDRDLRTVWLIRKETVARFLDSEPTIRHSSESLLQPTQNAICTEAMVL